MGVCSHQRGHKHHCQHTHPSHRYKDLLSALHPSPSRAEPSRRYFRMVSIPLFCEAVAF